MTEQTSVSSLDVKACVRLLKDAARRLRDADAVRGKGTNYKLAAGIDALASALPGMGKDSQRLDWLNADTQRLEEVFGATVRNEQNGDVRAIIDAARATCRRCGHLVSRHGKRTGCLRFSCDCPETADAARAAQPEEKP